MSQSTPKPQNVLLPPCLLHPHLLPPNVLRSLLRAVRLRALLLPVRALLPPLSPSGKLSLALHATLPSPIVFCSADQ